MLEEILIVEFAGVGLVGVDARVESWWSVSWLAGVAQCWGGCAFCRPVSGCGSITPVWSSDAACCGSAWWRAALGTQGPTSHGPSLSLPARRRSPTATARPQEVSKNLFLIMYSCGMFAWQRQSRSEHWSKLFFSPKATYMWDRMQSRQLSKHLGKKIKQISRIFQI